MSVTVRRTWAYPSTAMLMGQSPVRADRLGDPLYAAPRDRGRGADRSLRVVVRAGPRPGRRHAPDGVAGDHVQPRGGPAARRAAARARAGRPRRDLLPAGRVAGGGLGLGTLGPGFLNLDPTLLAAVVRSRPGGGAVITVRASAKVRRVEQTTPAVSS